MTFRGRISGDSWRKRLHSASHLLETYRPVEFSREVFLRRSVSSSAILADSVVPEVFQVLVLVDVQVAPPVLLFYQSFIKVLMPSMLIVSLKSKHKQRGILVNILSNICMGQSA